MASGRGVRRKRPRRRQGHPAHQVLEDVLFRQRRIRARKGRGSYRRERIEKEESDE